MIERDKEMYKKYLKDKENEMAQRNIIRSKWQTKQ